ncbi:acyltransferase [Marinifilum sp.]|uniref:acyltransferase n=1 Tax=Marinifilum sp. TaxID=2033137 RepID=UPI003BAC5A5E
MLSNMTETCDRMFSIVKCMVLLFQKKIKFKSPFFIGKGATFLFSSSYSKITFKGKTKLCRYVEIGGSGKIVAGNHLVVNAYSRIIAEKQITIGHDVLIARYVTILDHDHSIDNVLNGDFNTLESKEISIGNYVWIGDKVTILKGVHIGNKVVIGAHSVVTKDIPDNSVVIGIPAKVVRKI